MINSSVVIEKTHGVMHFSHLIMQVTNAASETTVNSHTVVTDEALTELPLTTKTITWFVGQPSQWNTTGTVILLKILPETASPLILYSKSKKNWREDNSQSNQHNGNTLFNQKENANCWILLSHSGAVQIHQTSGHGNPQQDSGKWSRSSVLT